MEPSNVDTLLWYLVGVTVIGIITAFMWPRRKVSDADAFRNELRKRLRK